MLLKLRKLVEREEFEGWQDDGFFEMVLSASIPEQAPAKAQQLATEIQSAYVLMRELYWAGENGFAAANKSVIVGLLDELRQVVLAETD